MLLHETRLELFFVSTFQDTVYIYLHVNSNNNRKSGNDRDRQTDRGRESQETRICFDNSNSCFWKDFQKTPFFLRVLINSFCHTFQNRQMKKDGEKDHGKEFSWEKIF